MLDKKTTAVLRVLFKLAGGNAYKVVTIDEILANLSQKSQYDAEIIKQTIDFLEKQQYLNIKFSEEKTYCYSLLSKARIYLEQEVFTTKTKKTSTITANYFYMILSSFTGTMLALLIFFYLTF